MSTNETLMIEPKKVVIPDNYFRKPDEKMVSEYTEFAKNSPRWPFPPIALEIVKPPKSKKGIEAYELRDGQHRVYAAIRAGIGKIPYTLVSFATEADRLKYVYHANQHGIRFRLSDRDSLVKRIALALGYELGKRTEKNGTITAGLIKDTGLSKMSVSRILKGKQTVTSKKERKKEECPVCGEEFQNLSAHLNSKKADAEHKEEMEKRAEKKAQLSVVEYARDVARRFGVLFDEVIGLDEQVEETKEALSKTNLAARIVTFQKWLAIKG